MQFDTPQQRLQEDLIWAACSVDMIEYSGIPAAHGLSSIDQSPAMEALKLWLHEHDHHTALSQLIVERKPRRLGIYFEVLWQYILEHYPGFELTQRNLAVLTGKRTLGEMDFVYFCKTRQRFVHLETAVKFYLGLPAQNPTQQMMWSNWIGPGCIDRLDIKLNKMFDKQTRLSDTSEGLAILHSLGVENTLREICLKGYFFYPYADNSRSPEHSHHQHARGYWLPSSQLNKLPHEDMWYIMRKEEWLSPVMLVEPEPLLASQQLEQTVDRYFARHKFPLMAACMVSSDAGLKERERFFITPDDWPTAPS